MAFACSCRVLSDCRGPVSKGPADDDRVTARERTFLPDGDGVHDESVIGAPTPMKRPRFLARLVLLGMMVTCVAAAQDSVDSAETSSNLDLMRRLAERVATTVAESVWRGQADTASVLVRPSEFAWYIENALRRGFSNDGMYVIASSGSGLSAEFGIGSLAVTYTNTRRLGLFGSTIVDRKITVDITARVVDVRSGSILLAHDYTESLMDNVEVSHIASLENPMLSVTRGSLPAEGFLSHIAEPVIIVGAVAVAVFLLFHVRS